MNSEEKNFLKKLGLSNNSIDYFGQGFKTLLENETSSKQYEINQKPEFKPTIDLNRFSNDNSKINRNDKCSCGSGKKFKKCCLK
jgi:uncharacterized protein YecA (UPF0149 family)